MQIKVLNKTSIFKHLLNNLKVGPDASKLGLVKYIFRIYSYNPANLKLYVADIGTGYTPTARCKYDNSQ